MIKEAMFTFNDPNLIDQMRQLVEDALLSEIWQQETIDLAVRTYLEEDYLPWVLSFRDLVKLNKIGDNIFEHLFVLSETPHLIPEALGAQERRYHKKTS